MSEGNEKIAVSCAGRVVSVEVPAKTLKGVFGKWYAEREKSQGKRMIRKRSSKMKMSKITLKKENSSPRRPKRAVLRRIKIWS